ncbi:MAG: hypothetical protein FJX76_19870 [Armatimonadetes bacterium]|nr:hypothetical protein [Armatimonadota bacterium]
MTRIARISLVALALLLWGGSAAHAQISVGPTTVTGTMLTVDTANVYLTVPQGTISIPYRRASFYVNGYRMNVNDLKQGMLVTSQVRRATLYTGGTVAGYPVNASQPYYPGQYGPGPVIIGPTPYNPPPQPQINTYSPMVYVRLKNGGQVIQMPWAAAIDGRNAGVLIIMGPPDPQTGAPPSQPFPEYQ